MARAGLCIFYGCIIVYAAQGLRARGQCTRRRSLTMPPRAAASTAADQLKGDIISTIQFLGTMRGMQGYEGARDVQFRSLLARVKAVRGAQEGAAVAEVWAKGRSKVKLSPRHWPRL